MLDVFSPVDGNEACVKMLEDCVKIAKEGRVCHVSVIMVRSMSDVSARFCGTAGMEIAGYYGTGLLQKSLLEVPLKRMPNAANPDAPANRLVYNMAKMPVCFDFVGTLLDAEMTRIREGAPGPLRVAWFWGQDGDSQVALNTEQRMQNFDGIMRPLVRLIGAVEDQEALDGRHIDHCTVKPVTEAYLRGEPRPTFKAPEKYCEVIDEFVRETFGRPPVTITLREAHHTPHRNSNLTEWLALANWLESQGEQVVFVRDTAKAREPLDGFTTCYAASEDLMIRCALYQVARANLFVANGPAMLAVFGDKPWLIINEAQEHGNYRANTAAGWHACTGIRPGEQWPWCRDDQRIIWERDTFEIMKRAWLAHIAPRLSQQDSGYQLEPEDEANVA